MRIERHIDFCVLMTPAHQLKAFSPDTLILISGNIDIDGEEALPAFRADELYCDTRFRRASADISVSPRHAAPTASTCRLVLAKATPPRSIITPPPCTIL